MVRLTKIYTKTGDKGDTGLGDGSRVAHSPSAHTRGDMTTSMGE
jgi:cob(I)alamin adenosyltransferase